MTTYVHAQSLTPLTAAAGMQATTVCLKEHQPEQLLKETERAALKTINQQLSAIKLSSLNDQALASLVKTLKNYQDQLESMPHTVDVCKVSMHLKKIIMHLQQQVQTRLVQPITQQYNLIEQRFTTLQDPNHIVTYKSYTQLLDLLGQLYGLVLQLQSVEQGWAKTFIQPSLSLTRHALIEMEKTLMMYGQDLFKKEYPRRTTECHALMKLWIDDLDTDAVTQKEQAVMVSEQQVAPFFERTVKSDLLMPVLQRAHKEFVMSPCFHKLKTKAQKAPSTDTCSLASVIVQEGDKDKELYVGGS